MTENDPPKPVKTWERRKRTTEENNGRKRRKERTSTHLDTKTQKLKELVAVGVAEDDTADEATKAESDGEGVRL
jgi:hypothetical protein